MAMAAVSAILAAAVPAPAQADTEPEPKVAFTVSDDRITESSGLAASTRHPGIVYTHNDSGDTPQLFAVGSDGRTRATFTIAGARARDWEGIALGRDGSGRPALFVADIGDNLGGAWPYVTVYRVPEPATLRDQTLRATVFRLKYADGPRNAESVLIDPRSNRLYVASKMLSGALYAAPATLRTGRTNVLKRVGDAPAIATDAAFAPDGRTFAIRTYFAAHIYSAPGKLLQVVPLPDQIQGESIAYAANGRSLLVGSEEVDQPVWRVPLPADAMPSPTATSKGGTPKGATPKGTASKEPPAVDERRADGDTAFALLAAAALAAVLITVVARRRS